MASPESRLPNPEEIKPILDAVKADAVLIEEQTTGLYEYTNSIVADAAMMLDSARLFPTVPTIRGGEREQKLLYVGDLPYQEDWNGLSKGHLFLHTDGSIWGHQIVRMEGFSTVNAYDPEPLSAEQRFKLAEPALQAISHVLALALKGRAYYESAGGHLVGSSRVVCLKELQNGNSSQAVTA